MTREIIKKGFDFFNYNASDFNKENGITESIVLKCNLENIEKYAGIRSAREYVYSLVEVVEIRIMQGKTRSGINVYYKYENRWGSTLINHCNIKDLSQESGERILNYIKGAIH